MFLCMSLLSFCFQYPLSNCKLLDGKTHALLTSPSTMSHKQYCSINMFICVGIELSGRTDMKYRLKANTISYYFLYFFRLNFLSDFFNIQRLYSEKNCLFLKLTIMLLSVSRACSISALVFLSCWHLDPSR